MLYKFSIILLFVNVIQINAHIKISGEDSGRKKFVSKCCPMKQYVGTRKMCVPQNESYSFSAVEVYDDYMNKMDKSFDEVLTLAPGKFEDAFFKKESVDVTILDYKTYVLHNGDLKLEVPNEYDRWIPVPNANYCIDYSVISSKPSIRYWYYTPEEEETDDVYVSTFNNYGMLVSCFFMLLVLIVYCLLPELRNLCGMILMATISSLLLAFLFLVTLLITEHTAEACIGLTLMIYYFFLSSFCWMTVMSFDIWWTFRGYLKARPIHRRGHNFKFWTYCLYAYGVPLAMTIFMGVLNSLDLRHLPWFITPHVPQSCFLNGGYKFLYLYIPMLILIICNWMFYVMTAFNVWEWSRGSAMLETVAAGTQRAHRRQRNRFMLYLKLSVVMGLMYVFEIISFRYPGYKIWYIIDAYNIFIGFALFLIFVCKRKILRKLCKRYAGIKNTRWYIPKSYSSSASGSNQEAISLQLKVCSNPSGRNGITNSSIRK